MGVWKKVSWRYLAVATAVLLGLQVYLYGYGTQIIVIFMCTFAASFDLIRRCGVMGCEGANLFRAG